MRDGDVQGTDTREAPRDHRFAFLGWWGEYLLDERKRRGLSQGEVAQLAGIDQARVSKAEKLGSFINQVKIADAFGIPIDRVAAGAAALRDAQVAEAGGEAA